MRLQPRQSGRSLLDLVIVLLSIAGLVAANDRNHKYTAGERVQLWVNKVGPYNNPQETYNYYYLPFCHAKPEERPQHRWAGLGEVLEGNELIDSQLSISFKEPVEKMAYCQQMLSPRSAATFRRAIRHHYWYEFFLDDLPIWGFIGDNVVGDGAAADGRQLIYTHKAFDIGFNGPHIIQVNLTSGDPVPLEDGQILEFTYSVAWKEMSLPFHRRFERYLDYNFFEHQIHWFSIFNSFMMVLFLVGLVSMILMRTLKKDYQRYAKDDDDIETLERDLSQESGWKLLHGDVFRAPPRLSLLCALVGTGAQLALLVLFVILITIAGTLFIERGTIVTVFILCYALTSFVGGYVSGGMHARHGGRTWIPTMLLTASLLPGLFFGIAFLLNTIAILYHSLEAAPFTTIVIMLLIWAFISFPLCLLGTVLGRNWSGTARNPCRTKRIPSPIPAKTWYLRPTVIAIMGGLLPFGSIFIELYFIFTSFWNNKIYFVYGFMLLVFVMLCVVTACITIVATYFLLNAENYLWHWTSFHSAASTGIYVYVYSIHYFLFKTKMTGFFQTAFYFGYMAMFCMGLSILCGAVGYLSAASFVKRIYRNIKCD